MAILPLKKELKTQILEDVIDAPTADSLMRLLGRIGAEQNIRRQEMDTVAGSLGAAIGRLIHRIDVLEGRVRTLESWVGMRRPDDENGD